MIPVTITAGSVAVGFCPATWQAVLNEFVAKMTASVSGTNNSFNYGSGLPAAADQNKPWIEIDVNGHILSISNWNTALGIWDPYDGRPYYAITTGAANSYVFTLNDRSIVDLPSIAGRLFLARANFSNTGPATIEVHGAVAALVAKSIRKAFNQTLASGDIQNGQLFTFSYDSANDWFQMLSPVGQAPATANEYALLQYRVAAGTAGIAYAVGTVTLPINTEVLDSNAIVSLAANQFTLVAGRYQLKIRVPVYSTAGGVGTGQLFIYNVTGAAEVANANQGVRVNNSDDAYEVGLDFFLNIGLANVYELRLQVGGNTILVGSPGNTGGREEVYTSLAITKFPA